MLRADALARLTGLAPTYQMVPRKPQALGLPLAEPIAVKQIRLTAFYILQFMSAAAELPRACNIVQRAELAWCWGRLLARAHFFTFTPISTIPRLFKMSRRLAIADTVRFNFRAIEGLSIFDSSSARSCASSAGIHGWLAGRGPRFILPSP